MQKSINSEHRIIKIAWVKEIKLKILVYIVQRYGVPVVLYNTQRRIYPDDF